jgi:hypothetical protein
VPEEQAVSPALEDFLTALASDPRVDWRAPHLWEAALTGLTPTQARQVLATFPATTRHMTAGDFGRAKARMFPPPTCETCANTGQNWDGEQYQYCGCDMGRHMAALNRRIVERADAERPAWMMPSTRRLTVVE